MSAELKQYEDDEEYVDVRSLPLKPPQALVPAEKAQRRPWHPVMWDDTPAPVQRPTTDTDTDDEQEDRSSKEYPHKQRIINLRRMIAEGKVKPTPETLIFFLCNKFAISDERQNKLKL